MTLRICDLRCASNNLQFALQNTPQMANSSEKPEMILEPSISFNKIGCLLIPTATFDIGYD